MVTSDFSVFQPHTTCFVFGSHLIYIYIYIHIERERFIEELEEPSELPGGLSEVIRFIRVIRIIRALTFHSNTVRLYAVTFNVGSEKYAKRAGTKANCNLFKHVNNNI